MRASRRWPENGMEFCSIYLRPVPKLRWAGSGRGKRGGLRIIYYWLREDGHVWLLTIYAKNEARDIPHAVLKMLRKEIEK